MTRTFPHLAAWSSRQARHAARALRLAARGPGRERDILLQSLKAAAAAVIAWVIAGVVLHAPLAFLAPWVAVIMMHATVYRTVVRALRQMVAVVLGVFAATGAYLLVGDRTLALAIVLAVMMPLAYWREFGDEGTYGPLTALLMLTSETPAMHDLLYRLMETALGVTVGIVVNAAVLPPVHLRNARRATRAVADELCRLLGGLAGALREEWDIDRAREWLGESERSYGRVDEAWAAIDQGRESLWLNLRRRSTHTEPDLSPALAPLEHLAKQTHAVCRTLVNAMEAGMPAPDAEFVAFFTDVLEHGADAVQTYQRLRLEAPWPPPPDSIGALRERAHRLRERLRTNQFRADGWMAYEALCVQVDRLLSALTDVLDEPAGDPRA